MNSVNGSRVEVDAAASLGRESHAQQVAPGRQQATASDLRSRQSADQADGTLNPGLKAAGKRKKANPAPAYHDDRDTLVISNVHESYSYHKIFETMRAFGRILRIRIVYDGD